MRIYFLILFFLQIIFSQPSNATLIEINDDGSTTTYEAFDYLSAHRHFAIVKQSPPSDIYNIVQKYADLYGIDPSLIHAIIQTESAYDPKAISSAGAEGLMQIMPKTAESLGITDSFDTDQNIEAGVRYLKNLLDQYDGNLEFALAAYNAGEGSVQKYGGVPPYPETITYIKKIKKILE